jgi:hypothetical protein
MSKNNMDSKEIFDFIKDNQQEYTQYVAGIDIENNKVSKVDWIQNQFGYYEDDEIKVELEQLDFNDYDDDYDDGTYQLTILFSIYTDSNGVGHFWNYLEIEHLECEFQYNKDENITNDVQYTGNIFDIFNK